MDVSCVHLLSLLRENGELRAAAKEVVDNGCLVGLHFHPPQFNNRQKIVDEDLVAIITRGVCIDGISLWARAYGNRCLHAGNISGFGRKFF